MNTPGSPNTTAPRTRNSAANSVLPQPAPPHTSVGRPRGNPPPVISSRPWMPVGHLGKRAAGEVIGGRLVLIQKRVGVKAEEETNGRERNIRSRRVKFELGFGPR